MTYIAVLFRRSARHWLRLGLGRGEAGGEDRNVCSIWNRSPGTRKPCGKHPLDREIFLRKNKEQRTKNKTTFRPPLSTIVGYKTMPYSCASTSMYVCFSAQLPPHLDYHSDQEAPILVVGPASSLGLTVNTSLNAKPTDFPHTAR